MPHPFRIEIYAGRRGLLKRKQWFARVVATANGENVFRSSEGYNNQLDLVHICDRVYPGFPKKFMDPPSAVPVDLEDQ
jgi:hypothetical protein